MLAVLSAKGSPGVTTTALALTAAASSPARAASLGPALMVEADPAGGDLECWCGPKGEPGLLRLATGERRAAAVDVVPDVPAVLAPTGREAASAALRSATGLARSLARVQGTVIVDGGRWFAGSADHCSGLVDEASLVAVVCRPAMASVEHARGVVAAVRRSHSQVVGIVVGDSGPYPVREVADALGVPVAGVLPWDRRGVAKLIERGARRARFRSRLERAADGALETLIQLGNVPATRAVAYG